MNHSYFHFILLFCFNQFNGERSASAIYHLLNGKKSSQTIQDGKLFNLSHLFSVFPRVSRQQLNEACDFLNQEGLIEQLPNQHYILTKKGKSILNENLHSNPIPAYLNGWEYGDVGRLFWRRLSLLVQVISNIAYEKTNYLPLTKNQEDLQWIKTFLKQIKLQKSELIDLLHKEIKQSLFIHSKREATIFIQRLTSSKKIGQTVEQIAATYKEDPIYIYLLFWNIIHSIIQQQLSCENQFVVLNKIIKDKLKKNMLTASTATTRSYLLQGLTIPEIAHLRSLKESTIEDHVVEITLHDKTFTPTAFLTLEDNKRIDNAINLLQTHQLKKVKEYLNHQYSYFQIRLVYAMNGRNE